MLFKYIIKLLTVILFAILAVEIFFALFDLHASTHVDRHSDFKRMELINSSLHSLIEHLNSHRQNTISTISTNNLQIEIEKITPIEKSSNDSIEVKLPRKPGSEIKAIIFTMDSIASYEASSVVGGAAGELTIRHSLELALKTLGVRVSVMKSDDEFNRCNLSYFDIIILDPWTWAAKGWVPKRNLLNQDSKVYILDFFGSTQLRGKGLQISSNRFLTAFGGSPENTFLGYHMDENILKLKHTSVVKNNSSVIKRNQGVIWGKDIKHFKGNEAMLQAVAEFSMLELAGTKLLTTSSSRVFPMNSKIKWIGHQSSHNWLELLMQSKFLIGLGNPLLGPSAMDAIALGCMFINPVYNKPLVLTSGMQYSSQHPYAAEKYDLPHVCNYQQGNKEELLKCIRLAVTQQPDLEPFVPEDFQFKAYVNRVKRIFSL